MNVKAPSLSSHCDLLILIFELFYTPKFRIRFDLMNLNLKEFLLWGFQASCGLWKLAIISSEKAERPRVLI